MAICGIYKIENDINDNLYIGQSVDIEGRWRQHCRLIDDGCVIHKAMIKYGVEHFSCSVIETCAENELDEKEIYWINFYDSYKKGYNMTIGGKNQTHLQRNPVEVYDLEGNYIETCSSAGEASRKYNINRSLLSQILLHRRKSANGYQFKRQDDSFNITKYSQEKTGPSGTPVVQMDTNNNFIKYYPSQSEAYRQTGILAQNIGKCCNGTLKSCGGYKWRNATEEEKELFKTL